MRGALLCAAQTLDRQWVVVAQEALRVSLTSRCNPEEALKVVNIFHALRKSGVKPADVFVITPYSAQKALIEVRSAMLHSRMLFVSVQLELRLFFPERACCASRGSLAGTSFVKSCMFVNMQFSAE